ncbi:MAG: hypothetical protein ACK47B_21675 [Armatimonadota bacterium]
MLVNCTTERRPSELVAVARQEDAAPAASVQGVASSVTTFTLPVEFLGSRGQVLHELRETEDGGGLFNVYDQAGMCRVTVRADERGAVVTLLGESGHELIILEQCGKDTQIGIYAPGAANDEFDTVPRVSLYGCNELPGSMEIAATETRFTRVSLTEDGDLVHHASRGGAK